MINIKLNASVRNPVVYKSCYIYYNYLLKNNTYAHVRLVC